MTMLQDWPYEIRAAIAIYLPINKRIKDYALICKNLFEPILLFDPAFAEQHMTQAIATIPPRERRAIWHDWKHLPINYRTAVFLISEFWDGLEVVNSIYEGPKWCANVSPGIVDVTILHALAVSREFSQFVVDHPHPLAWAAKLGCFESAVTLLSDFFVDPSAGGDSAIMLASKMGHIDIVRLLLSDKRTNPGAMDDRAVVMAAQRGHFEVVKMLISDWRVNPSAHDNACFVYACQAGNLEAVRMMMRLSQVNPAARNNAALLAACKNGHVQVLEELLRDARVDPSARSNLGLHLAAESGSSDIVKVLLEDTRTDPRSQDNKGVVLFGRYVNTSPNALFAACFNGHVEVVQELMKDGRVDISIGNGRAVQLADMNGHQQVVQLLKQAGRHVLRNTID